jgi:hypothetical protein
MNLKLTLLFTLAVLGTELWTQKEPKTNPTSTEYTLLFFESSDGFSNRSGPKSKDYWDRWTTYIGKIRSSGKVLGGNALSDASTAKVVGNQIPERAAPRLGGYLIVSADTAEAASKFAAGCPAIEDGGYVEIRSVLKMDQDGATR